MFPWSVRVLQQWLADYRDLFDAAAVSSSLWPTERTPALIPDVGEANSTRSPGRRPATRLKHSPASLPG